MNDLRLLIADSGPGLFGTAKYLLRMAPGLAERGIEPILAAPPTELREAWADLGFPWRELQVPQERSIRPGGTGRPTLALMRREADAARKSGRQLSQMMAELDAHVLHANSHWLHTDAAIACRKGDWPTILHLHEEPSAGIARALRAAAVLATSSTVAVSAALAATVPWPARRKVHVITNGVDTTEFTPRAARAETRADLAAPGTEVVLLAVTRIDPAKRIEDLIEVVSRVRETVPGVSLAIAGSTTTFPDYDARVRSLANERLGDAVRFLGQRDDIPELLASSDLLLHTGVIEGFPLVMIEAHACGLPVVAYDVAGVGEIVEVGSTGWLSPAKDTVHLARGLAQLCADADLRTAQGRRARARAEAHFSLEAQVDAYASLIRTTVGDGKVGERAPKAHAS